MSTMFLSTLFLSAIGALPRWWHTTNWGYYPSAKLGFVFVVMLLFFMSDSNPEPTPVPKAIPMAPELHSVAFQNTNNVRAMWQGRLLPSGTLYAQQP